MVIAAGVLLVLTLAGYVAGVRQLELAADFRPYYLAAALLLLVLALSYRWWARRRFSRVMFVLLGLIISVNGWEVVPWLWPRAAEPSPVGLRMKLLAFNVEASNKRYQDVRAWVTAEQSDVAMFCESDDRWASELKELERVFVHHVRIPQLTMDVFSRHPVIHTQVFQFGEQRGFCAVELQVGEGRLTFVGAHACPRIPWGREGFIWRTRMLGEGVAREVPKLVRPLVLMGDLNASPWSPPFQRAVRESGLKDARLGNGLLPTRRSHPFPARLLWNALDHCLTSREVAVQRMWTGPFLGSDHRAVLVEVAIPESPPDRDANSP
jgi:endonuclease/exonuclease/phosphatase (EEP) superfamily protein YafD